jgi:hypothetical protein
MTTLRQAEANRRNSLLSTGPRTDAGKDQSKRNAYQHGLAGAGVVRPEDEAMAVADRITSFGQALPAADAFDQWLIELASIASVKLDRCREKELALIVKTARRVALFWDDDRAQQAEELAAQLAPNPPAISRRLRQTRQGCQLLTDRWEDLGRALDAGGEWTAAQRSLALDLLGVSAERRAMGLTELDAAPEQDVRALSAAIVARERGRLAQLGASPGLVELDALERAQAVQGQDLGDSAEARLLARYESESRRRLVWALGQYHQRRRAQERTARDANRAVVEAMQRRDRDERLAAQEATTMRQVTRLLNRLDESEPASSAAAPAAAVASGPSASVSATATLAGAAAVAASPRPQMAATAPSPAPAPPRESRGARKRREAREWAENQRLLREQKREQR